jgi:ATP-dependent DNA helicase RecG
VIGQSCDANGQPIFPQVVLQENQLDNIQQELLSLTAKVPFQS